MENSDIRWKQRFINFEKAFLLFKQGIEEYGNTDIDIVKEGIIQRFEFTHELAWNVMKDYLVYEGIAGITGSRSATREAFSQGLITNGSEWMKMLETRNITVHAYDDDVLQRHFIKIKGIYYPLIEEFYLKMKTYL